MGIWLIYHGIAAANRSQYLAWFEDQHIQEKLDRPGYDWAAHYEVTQGGSTDHPEHAFIALFGAENSRIFYDPSPAQIKPHQDKLTREMIGLRQAPLSLIATQEWQQLPPSTTTSSLSVSSPYLGLGIFSSDADDQTVAAWCAQQHFPKIALEDRHRATSKYLASSGSPRHIVLEEYSGAGSSSHDLENVALSWAEIPQEQLFAHPALAECRLYREAP